MNPRDGHNLGQFLERLPAPGALPHRADGMPSGRPHRADHASGDQHRETSPEYRASVDNRSRRFPARCIARDIEPRRPERRGGSPVSPPVEPLTTSGLPAGLVVSEHGRSPRAIALRRSTKLTVCHQFRCGGKYVGKTKTVL